MAENGRPTIVIAGAGSIGCFVGGVIAHGGGDVRFLGRERISAMILEHGLRVTDHDGLDARIAPADLKVSTDPSVLAEADIVIVTVKSGATAEMGALIAAHAPTAAKIVSLQNGISNADVLRDTLPGRDVRAGMIAYNVLNAGEGRFHRGTGGNIVIEAGEGDLAQTLNKPDLAVHESSDIRSVQWGKLLINLNNALNALSGAPLLEELSNREWRSLFADQIAEGLPALKAEGVKPRSAFPLPIAALPHVMRLPTPLYRMVAGPSLKIDPQARSSMWEDLEQGRNTEIGELQETIVALCEKHALPAPVNARVAALIRECEEKGGGSPKMTPAAVRAGV